MEKFWILKINKQALQDNLQSNNPQINDIWTNWQHLTQGIVVHLSKIVKLQASQATPSWMEKDDTKLEN